MSALQDILDKMYVEEELLAQLDEEQKHILFIKMREEQIRRWRIREAELEEKERDEPPRKKTGRRVQWLKGRNGDVWVWVMGDHPEDKSIDDIIENETRQKVRALVEAELMRETAGGPDTDEEQLKQQLRQMRLGTPNEKTTESRSSHQNTDPRATVNLVNSVPYYAQVTTGNNSKPYDGSDGSSFDSSNGQNSMDDLESNNESTKKPLMIKKLFGKSGGTQQDSNKASPLPWKVLSNRRSESPAKSLKDNIYQSINPDEQNGSFRAENDESDKLDSSSHLVRSYNPSSSRQPPSLNGNSQTGDATTTHRKNVIRPPPPVPARPPHLARKPKDKGFVQAIRSYVPGSNPTTTYGQQNGPIRFPLVVEDTNGSNGNVNPDNSSKQSQNGEQVPQDEIEKRQSKLLEMLMEEHHRLKKEAEQEAESERLAYEERERKAREAEAQIKFIAQRAREQHQNGLRTSSALLPVLNNTSSTSFRDAVKSITRPPKPKDRSAIIRWYKQSEFPIGTGLDSSTKQPAIWFHGILSRQEADALLANQPSGAFLVRVSERIFGYAISYAVGDESGSSKHFLVEKIPEGYQFLGTNQVVHDSLARLVEYHEIRPITLKNQELLLYPIGQQNQIADYAELFDFQETTLAAHRHGRDVGH